MTAEYHQPIIGTLGFILSPDQDRVLMVHRNRRPDDDHYGKYNGLGGKMRFNEDVKSCLEREIREEAGLECLSMRLRGTINWTGFGPREESWLGFIFIIDRFSGTPPEENEEGRLEWVKIKRIPQLPMWEGDRCFIPLVFDDDPRPFHGYMPYDDNKMLSWSYSR